MLIRFIAHAGFYIEEDGFSLLIDPWFLDSTTQNPVLESIGGGFKTIDFQLPKTTERLENYAPDAIVISHFHVHHSPAIDIRTLCQNTLSKGRSVQIVHPPATDEMEANMRAKLPGAVVRTSVPPGEERTIGPFTLRAVHHTVPHHSGWYIQTKSGSVLHIADGRINKNRMDRSIDPVWLELSGLSPTFLFLSSGGHCEKREADGKRYLMPAGIFSPAEAAQVTEVIAPKAAALIGIYNHSIWKNNLEYIGQAALCEDEYLWATSWLVPETPILRLRPGMQLGTGDSSLKDRVFTYIQ